MHFYDALIIPTFGDFRCADWLTCGALALLSFRPAEILVWSLDTISVPMRQIARPSQANNSLHLLASFWHCQCNTLLLPCRPPASTVVPFSTSSARHFLLSGKPDKKKHQQFVRRWQKRLLGDSEPIGAHVDPYDPTSPVRIAPEEQGEYEEVLDDDATEKNKPAFRPYVPARYAAHLPHVGGEQWQKRQLETDLAREFEKLTLRTYTPLSLGMANDIKELTGTWYTLMDDNLHMAQIVHDVTARPYTEHNFGLHRKTTLPRELRSRFVQAVAEIYTLKQAGLNMELSRLGTSGIYEPPMWIHDIRLSKEDSGEVILIFPEGKSAEQLLRAMREAPVVEPIRAVEEIEPLVVKSPEISAPVSSQEPPATIPEAPAFKRAALVTMDSGKRPFDFMSNRPVPRAKLAQEARMEDVNKSSHLSPQPTVLPRSTISMVDMASAVESSRAAITQMRCAVFEQQAKLVTTEIEALRRATKHQAQIPLIEDVKWQHVPVVDLALKFAVRTLDLPLL